MDSTVYHMRTLLRNFHETTNMFLRYRAGKEASKRAEDVSKIYPEKHNRCTEAATGLTAAQRARQAGDVQAKRACRIDQAYNENSHFNFTKLHMLSYYADQIAE